MPLGAALARIVEGRAQPTGLATAFADRDMIDAILSRKVREAREEGGDACARFVMRGVDDGVL